MITLQPNVGLSIRLYNNSSRQLGQTVKSLERLSTGKQINRPSDDPSGFVAAEQIRGELIDVGSELKDYGHQRSALNQRGSDLSVIQRGLIDLQDRVVEASGDLLNDRERDALQLEVDAVIEEFNRLAAEVAPDLGQLRTGGEASLDRGDPALAAQVVEVEAGTTLQQQVSVAADQRQLDAFEQLARDREVILTETLSQIEDADFAEETANLAISQTLTAAANAAMKYSQNTHADLIGGLLDEVEIGPERSARLI